MNEACITRACIKPHTDHKPVIWRFLRIVTMFTILMKFSQVGLGCAYCGKREDMGFDSSLQITNDVSYFYTYTGRFSCWLKIECLMKSYIGLRCSFYFFMKPKYLQKVYGYKICSEETVSKVRCLLNMTKHYKSALASKMFERCFKDLSQFLYSNDNVYLFIYFFMSSRGSL